MKLYYAPGACSLAPHIVAREAGIDIDLVKVDLKKKLTESGEDYLGLVPNGYVPALALDDGNVLTEGPVISQYLADQKPATGLAPKAGTLPRYRLLEKLGYINSEIHKTYSPLFNPATTPEVRSERVAYLKKRYEPLDRVLAESEFLIGDSFTVADAYLYTVTRWAQPMKVDLSEFPALMAFQERVGQRPSVQAALSAEGLAKAVPKSG